MAALEKVQIRIVSLSELKGRYLNSDRKNWGWVGFNLNLNQSNNLTAYQESSILETNMLWQIIQLGFTFTITFTIFLFAKD